MIDLFPVGRRHAARKHADRAFLGERGARLLGASPRHHFLIGILVADLGEVEATGRGDIRRRLDRIGKEGSEEHTSELQSLMRISYAVLCWKKKTTQSKPSWT